MISEIPSQTLPALPVRRRETLEIFDTALKLYRRYFWVLLGWSALVSATSFTFFLSSLLYLFACPLLYGAVSCCVAAAVRGQSVSFGQCWQFSKPRYGAMLGALVLSWLIFFCVMVVLYMAAALLFVAGVWVLANAPEPVQVVGGIIGFLLLMVFFGVLGVFAFGWTTMVPIVSCLEDDKRGVPSMGRALELLKGNWRRVFGICLLMGLAVLAFIGIVSGVFMLLNGVVSLWELFNGPTATTMIVLGGFWAFFLMFWNPAQTLVLSVLYLDLRVRREALDLEWTAYASAPPTATGAVALETPTHPITPTSPSESFSEGVGPTSLSAGVNANTLRPEERSEFSASSASIPTVHSPLADPAAISSAPTSPAYSSSEPSSVNVSLGKEPWELSSAEVAETTTSVPAPHQEPQTEIFPPSGDEARREI